MASSDKISGVDGAAVFDNNTVVITTWSLNITEGTKDVTGSDSSSWVEKLANGYAEWSGSFEGFVVDGTASQTHGGVAATLTLTAETGVTYAGTAIITSKDFSLTVSGGDAHKIAYAFEGDGILSETNA